MRSALKWILSTVLLANGVGVASVAQAFQFVPAGPFTSAAGVLKIKTPSSFGATLTCALSMSGEVSAFTGLKITSVSITGPGICSLLKAKYLSWPVSANSLSSVNISDMGFSLVGSVLPPSNCGVSEINANWNPANKSVTASNQALSGNCTIEQLDIVFPALSLVM
ncbi:alkane oxidation protein activator PraB [Pseudomonas sp. MWU15-20650]|uniref:alkane oxidation protein activator PraB n=1 Tax=Pseudomonas sp. MWU15-20650 TaxID=2933107 RepID=UPI00200D356A|nr:alkane oxidation protein activator PraB [Pseudomonas sp. MWU15-20650]